MITIVLPGDPISKKRHRCRCINGHGASFDPQVREDMEPMRSKIFKIWNDIFNDPHSTNANEARLIAQGDSFTVYLRFYMPLNKSDAVGLRNAKLWGIIPCNTKPDFDNLAKFYTDCATGIIWKDDMQITCGTSHKVRYSKNPRTEITIMSNKELTIDEKQIAVFKTFSPEELKEFMIKCTELAAFGEDNELYMEDNHKVPGESFLSQASMLLIDFATRFSDKLKKIARIHA